MRHLRSVLFALSASVCSAATFTWTGAGGDRQFANPANWSGGLVPPNDGSATLVFGDTGAGSVVLPASFAAQNVVFQNTSSASYAFNAVGAAEFTLTGGLTGSAVGGLDRFSSSVHLTLTSSEVIAVNSGSIQIDGSISGLGSLTKTGSGELKLTGNNSFTGGVTAASGTLTITGPSSLGSGTLHLAGANLLVSTLSDTVLLNPIVVDANSTLSGYDGKLIFLTGNVTLTNSVALQSAGTSTYFLTGAINESGGARSLTVGGLNPVVLAGTSNYTGGTQVNNGALVFGTASAIPSVGKITANALGYVGVGFTNSVQGSLLGHLSSTDFHGTIGFDSAPWMASPNTFNEQIDLTGLSGIAGLGSLTSARITGDIKVNPGSAYRFGGGGGALYVESNLTSQGTNLELNSPFGQPLTLVLRGNNTFLGSLDVLNSVLVLDSANAIASGRALNLQGPGYVGSTEQFLSSPNAFLGRIGNLASPNAIVGFDSSDPSAPRTVTQDIDLSVGGTRTDPYYLGTSTHVTLTGRITPTTGDALYLTAVKGGYLSVRSPLDSSIPSLVVGQTNSFDPQGGTVELLGNNTYKGGTQVLGGTLLVNSNGAVGTGAVAVRDRATLEIGGNTYFTNSLSLDSGARLSGNGMIATPGGTTIASGAILSPGSAGAVGRIAFNSSLTFGSGGVLEFDVRNTVGAPGASWDLISVSTGLLTLAATPTSPFAIDITSLSPAGAPGALIGFDPTQTYSWLFATSSVGITGFSSSQFVFNTTNFNNSLGGGTFFVSQNGGNLFINFTPVPEPGTVFLFAAGLGLVAALELRRRRK